jgi:molybdenum-dependent DNA-binding transcriptional regulator ModE
MMRGHGERLSRKREQLICALLEKASIAAAAQAVGISEKTARSWLQDAEFLKAYRAARRRLVEHATARLQRAMQFGVTTLLKILKEGTESNQLAAAKAILEYGSKGIDEDILSRLDALEQRLLPASAPSTNGVKQ